jgi:hypothetical protein
MLMSKYWRKLLLQQRNKKDQLIFKMPLKRISDQKSKTIEEFYTELAESSDEVSRQIGKATLELIDGLNRFFVNETIWCLTSLYRMVLLTRDDWRSPWNVIISWSGPSQFSVQYLIPNDKADNESQTLHSFTLNRTMIDVFKAMKSSGGWDNMDDL